MFLTRLSHFAQKSLVITPDGTRFLVSLLYKAVFGNSHTH